jgi:HSP20 family protein
VAIVAAATPTKRYKIIKINNRALVLVPRLFGVRRREIAESLWQRHSICISLIPDVSNGERGKAMLEIMRRSPAIGLTSTMSDFDKVFNDLFESFNLPSASLSLPSTDIYSENDNSMVVEMQAPGFDKKDIQINVKNGMLEISGKRTEKEEKKDNKKSYIVRESSSSFARRILLPEGADSEKISAELDKGVLKVTVPVEQSGLKSQHRKKINRLKKFLPRPKLSKELSIYNNPARAAGRSWPQSKQVLGLI